MIQTFNEVIRIAIEHSKQVMREAIELRKNGIEPSKLSKVYKRKWEIELYDLLINHFDSDLMLLGKDAGVKGDQNAKWVLIADLLDGSKNFLSYYIPFYSYNIALAHHNELILGICIDLARSEIHKAIKGKGAYINEVSIKKIKENTRARIMISNLLIKGYKYLHLGCSSLEVCLVAKGAAKLAIMSSWNIDIAASVLIAREAGSKVLDWNLNELKFPVREPKKLNYIVCGEEVVETNKDLIKDMVRNIVRY